MSSSSLLRKSHIAQEVATTFLQYNKELQSAGDQPCPWYLLLSWSASIFCARRDRGFAIKPVYAIVFKQVQTSDKPGFDGTAN
jgi:hypothetical protein